MSTEDELNRETSPESPRAAGNGSPSADEIIDGLRASLEQLKADANVRILRASRERERSWTASAT
jgi:hypothetical protein